MQLAVFATSPRHAREDAAAFSPAISGSRVLPRKVIDIDETALASGPLTSRLHGFDPWQLDRWPVRG